MVPDGLQTIGRSCRRRAAVSGMAALALLTAAPQARAQESVFMIGAGGFDFTDGQDKAGALELQYRGPRLIWWLQPMIGVLGTTDLAGYLYAGVSLDLPLTARLILRPSFAPGLYAEGNGKDLGNTLEFRTGAELSYRFDSGWRLGVEYYHLSNANLGDSNPGADSLMLTLAVPIGGR